MKRAHVIDETVPGDEPRGTTKEDPAMSMPSDAADAVESKGANEGPRDHEHTDTEHAPYVDDENVPHPGDANESR